MQWGLLGAGVLLGVLLSEAARGLWSMCRHPEDWDD